MYNANLKTSLVPKLQCLLSDVCLTCYWGGHHAAHISFPVYGPMSLKDIKAALRSELNQGAIAGNDERTRDDSGPIGDAWFYRAHAAVQRIKPNKKGQRRFFADVECAEDEEPVYAYFVFVDA